MTIRLVLGHHRVCHIPLHYLLGNVTNTGGVKKQKETCHQQTIGVEKENVLAVRNQYFIHTRHLLAECCSQKTVQAGGAKAVEDECHNVTAPSPMESFLGPATQIKSVAKISLDHLTGDRTHGVSVRYEFLGKFRGGIVTGYGNAE